jgi:hypothetical protein
MHSQHRDRVVGMRLPPKEMRGVAEAAGQEKISMSAVMRRAALREIEGKRQGRMRKPPVNIGTRG